MSDKKTQAKSVVVSPASARNVDFSQQTNNFKELLDQETILLERNEELEEKMNALFAPYKDNDENILSYGGSVASTIVYKKQNISEDIKRIAVTYGNHIWNITSQNQLTKMLSKVIGEESVEKLKKVSDYYNGSKEVDEKETKKLRSELAPLLTEQAQINRKLQTLSSKKSKSKEYVSYVKDVASIAASAKELDK